MNPPDLPASRRCLHFQPRWPSLAEGRIRLHFAHAIHAPTGNKRHTPTTTTTCCFSRCSPQSAMAMELDEAVHELHLEEAQRNRNPAQVFPIFPHLHLSSRIRGTNHSWPPLCKAGDELCRKSERTSPLSLSSCLPQHNCLSP